MPTDQQSKSEVLKQLNQMADKMTQLHKQLQEMAQVYNELMFSTFGVKDDGKNIGKLELLNMVAKFHE